MAKMCPCGCGSSVRFGKGGAANGYEQMTAMLEAVTPVVEALIAEPGISAADQQKSREYLRAGAQAQSDLLAHVHGTATPQTTPHLMDLANFLKEFERVALSVFRSVGIEPGR